MRHFEIINENYTPISDDRVEEVKAKYKNQIDQAMNVKPIYRGMRYTGELILADGAGMQRKSANTHNFFTLLTEILPSWKGWPPRAESFICSTGKHGAFSYARAMKYSSSVKDGNYGLYRVIPLENQPIAAAVENDIWYSFRTLEKLGIMSLMTFNEIMNVIITRYITYKKSSDVTLDSIKNLNSSQLKELLVSFQNDKEAVKNQIDEYRSSGSQMSPSFKLLKLFTSNESIISSLDYYLNTEGNDNHLFKNINEFKVDAGQEVWLSGKVLFILDDYK